MGNERLLVDNILSLLYIFQEKKNIFEQKSIEFL